MAKDQLPKPKKPPDGQKRPLKQPLDWRKSQPPDLPPEPDLQPDPDPHPRASCKKVKKAAATGNMFCPQWDKTTPSFFMSGGLIIE